MQIGLSPSGVIDVFTNIRAEPHRFEGLPLVENTWHHVVLTHTYNRIQSSVVTLYLDGQFIGTGKVTYPTNASSGLSAYIG